MKAPNQSMGPTSVNEDAATSFSLLGSPPNRVRREPFTRLSLPQPPRRSHIPGSNLSPFHERSLRRLSDQTELFRMHLVRPLLVAVALIIPSPYKNYPKGYEILETFLKSKNNTKQMGFAVYAAEVSRFVNRFRLASAFISIQLDNYSSSTVSGYNALFRVFLVWSAFERFLRAVGQKQETVVPLLTPYAPANSIEFIRQQDDQELFYDFVYNRVDKRHQHHLRAYKNRTLINITYWASAVRHLFAHGHLSAHPGGCEPVTVKLICDRISRFHLRVMEAEFYKIVSAYKQSLTNRSS